MPSQNNTLGDEFSDEALRSEIGDAGTPWRLCDTCVFGVRFRIKNKANLTEFLSEDISKEALKLDDNQELLTSGGFADPETRDKKVDDSRAAMFQQVKELDKLPQTNHVLIHHLHRTNYQALCWHTADMAIQSLPLPTDCGWEMED
ncbi:hypothetical protein JTB14_015500 [Gonioctena quinquepunctata]|nr:hypothetical protein JTB14_015500 [Gonioctena quinquepunctata]